MEMIVARRQANGEISCSAMAQPRFAVADAGHLKFRLELTRREAEICRLEWADNDDIGRSGAGA
jgi:hypothetical protein